MTVWGGGLENPVGERSRAPATSGYVAIGLAVFAAFLAIPPIEARSPTWPIAVGIVAAVLGIWTATRGRRRLGYGAVVGGLLGIGLGILATKSGPGTSKPSSMRRSWPRHSGLRRRSSSARSPASSPSGAES